MKEDPAGRNRGNKTPRHRAYLKKRKKNSRLIHGKETGRLRKETESRPSRHGEGGGPGGEGSAAARTDGREVKKRERRKILSLDTDIKSGDGIRRRRLDSAQLNGSPMIHQRGKG